MLSKLLKKKFPVAEADKERIKDLQSRFFRMQQGLWQSKRRAIIVFEGFDAAGKGGCIRKLTERCDPRGFRVHPIGPPRPEEQGKHYLYRFWKRLPEPGTMAIFDRSWYGRVLVERVEKLTPKERWHEAYKEIRHFEQMLLSDGVDLVKIFLAIHCDEQVKRFGDRINNPDKHWKISTADFRAHELWDEYVEAVDEMVEETDTKSAPWELIPADSKNYAQERALSYCTERLKHHAEWMDAQSKDDARLRVLRSQLKKLQSKSNKCGT